MYLIMASPSTAPMSPGKLAAQAAHAAVEAYLISDQNKQVVNRWRCGGHYKKIVLMADELPVAERYIRDRGFKTACIIDEGRTEFDGGLTPTAIGVEIVDKDELHVRETFSAFKLYGPPSTPPPGIYVKQEPPLGVLEVARRPSDSLSQRWARLRGRKAPD